MKPRNFPRSKSGVKTRAQRLATILEREVDFNLNLYRQFKTREQVLKRSARPHRWDR